MNKKLTFQIIKVIAFGVVPFAVEQSKKFMDAQIEEPKGE